MTLRPMVITGFDPFMAPKWVQPYLDCVDAIAAHGVGGGSRKCYIEMFRGGKVVGEVVVEVPGNE
jgi:hypothetical protein